MKVSGPLVTLGAVAALGIGMLFVNVSQEPEPTAPANSVAESATTTAVTTTPAPPSTPPPAPFPAKADYVGEIATKTGVLTLDITVDGGKAIAYACDGKSVEVWLSGGAENGVVNLANKANTSRAHRPPPGQHRRRDPVDRRKEVGLHHRRGRAAGGPVRLPGRRGAKQLDRRRERVRHRCPTAGRRINLARTHVVDRWHRRHQRPDG